MKDVNQYNVDWIKIPTTKLVLFLSEPEKFKKKVQDVFFFRNMLNLTNNIEKSVIVKKINNEFFPISYCENNITFKYNNIPDTILNKWFSDITLYDIAKRIFNIKKKDDISKKISELRDKINQVIERIDRTKIFLTDLIIDNLSSRLLIDSNSSLIPTW